MSILTRFTAACLLLLACSTAYPASYTVRILGAPGTASTAAGINAAGDVAGVSGGDAFVWHAGTMRFIEDDLANLGSGRLVTWNALGVDAQGALLAYSVDIDNNRRVIRYDAAGSHFLNDKPLNSTFDTLTPRQSFPGGQIAGTYQDFRTGRFAWFLSQGNDLLPFSIPGWANASPAAVNAQGWIAGTGTHSSSPAGFLLRNGSVNDLGPFFPALVNDLGNLAGTRAADASLFVWIGNKSFTIAPLPGRPNLRLFGMNNYAAVVGTAAGSDPADTVGFLWTPATGTQSLENLTADLRVTAAHGINDAGQVAVDVQGVNIASPHAARISP